MNNTENSNCVCKILKKISELQNFENAEIKDCSYHRLQCGSNCNCNTRPIMLICSNGDFLEMPIDDDEEKSNVFRVEKVNDCCAVLRILRIVDDYVQNNHSLISTNKFITINTNCFCAVKCLNDTNTNENILISEYQLFKNDILIDSESFPYGTHFFNTIDSNNEEENPTYKIEIKLFNLPNNSILKLINSITASNPNFIINSYTIVNNITYTLLTINFTVQTTVISNDNLKIALIENTEEESIISFFIENEIGLIIEFNFLMTVVNVYP